MSVTRYRTGFNGLCNTNAGLGPIDLQAAESVLRFQIRWREQKTLARRWQAGTPVLLLDGVILLAAGRLFP